MSQPTEWLQIERDVQPLRGLLAQAADTVVDENVSNYPIFFAFRGDDSTVIGLPVIQAGPATGPWSYNLSTLEELAAKRIIGPDRIDPFRKVYNNSPDTLCFLVHSEGETRFAFVHRTDREEE